MGRRPIPRQRGLFVKSPLWNPEKQRLTFIVWFFIVCSQGIKRPTYMPPAFDGLYFSELAQVIFADLWWIVKLEWYYQIYIIPCAFFGVLRTFFAKKVLSRRRQNRHRRFAKCLRCIHGAPPHTPPKGTFCKKSPLESRKTAFDFYCLVFHRLLTRYQKTDVHAAGFWWIILFRISPSYLRWSLMDCKIGVILPNLYYPLCVFWSS